MRKQEMPNTRGRSKKGAEEKEKEEGGQEREIEIVTDNEMEQPMGCLLYTSYLIIYYAFLIKPHVSTSICNVIVFYEV